MRISKQAAWAAAGAAAFLGAAAALVWPAWDGQTARGFLSRDQSAKAQAVITAWPAYSALAARVMMEEYGPPTEADASHLA